MPRLKSALAATTIALGLAVAPVGVAFAAHPSKACDAYSRHCKPPGKKHHKPPVVLGEKLHQPLPFTGAEVTGIAIGGVALLGGGGILVVAGRRRKKSA